MTDIVERLRSVGGLEGTGRWYINPDGPEAADEIEQLRKQVHLLKSNLSIIEDNAHHCLMLVGGSLD